MTLLRFLACLLAYGTAVQAQNPAPAPTTNPNAPLTTAPITTAATTTLKASTHVVVLDVVVTDKVGQPVAGLTKQDFALREDGQPQSIRNFEAMTAGQPLSEATPHTILLIDEMNTEFDDMALPGHPGYAVRTSDGYYALPTDAHMPQERWPGSWAAH